MLLSVCYYKLLRGGLCLCTFTTKKVIRTSQVLRNGLWWPLGILTAITPSFTPQIGPWEGHGCLWCLVKVIEVTLSYWFFLRLCRPIWPPLTMSCTPCRLLYLAAPFSCVLFKSHWTVFKLWSPNRQLSWIGLCNKYADTRKTVTNLNQIKKLIFIHHCTNVCTQNSDC